MTPRLIVSVSGLRDTTLDDAVDLVGELERRSVPVSLLVAPRRGHEYRLAEDAGTQDWLRHRRAQGDAIVLLAQDATIRIVTPGPGGRKPHLESMSYRPEERVLLRDAVAVFSVDGRLWETFDDSRICAAEPGQVRCYDARDGIAAGPWLDMASGPDGRILARSAAAVATLAPGAARWSSATCRSGPTTRARSRPCARRSGS